MPNPVDADRREAQEPAAKKAKLTTATADVVNTNKNRNTNTIDGTDANANAKQKQQSSLLNFFSSSKLKPKTKRSSSESKKTDEKPNASPAAAPPANTNDTDTTEKSTTKAHTIGKSAPTGNDDNNNKDNNKDNNKNDHHNSSVEAIVPTKVPPSSASWQSLHDNFVLVRRPRLRSHSAQQQQQQQQQPRTKVAAFDLDGTLLKWSSESPGFWPNQLHHYELWNSSVVTKMRKLYDDEKYLLVVVTNQGGIQGAHTGKKATLLKSLTDWLESLVKRPLIVIASTKSAKKYKERSFHKPTPKMWTKILVPCFGKRSAPFDPRSSFFVGDSADEDDAQGGVDKKFATGAGLGAFHTPEDYFGPSHQEVREQRAQLGSGGGGGDGHGDGGDAIPESALEARAALLGGYLLGAGEGDGDDRDRDRDHEKHHRPILLLLSGVQGSGKSTFCRKVLFGRSTGNHNESSDTAADEKGNQPWVWLSQDTINNGKPGKRETVEERAREALRSGRSVLLDRMHLDEEQRTTMIENVVSTQKDLRSRVRIHVVVLNPSKDVVARRVKHRTNHPGKVEGDSGVRIALRSMGRLVIPTYQEGAANNNNNNNSNSNSKNNETGPIELISVASTEHVAVRLALRYHDATAAHPAKNSRSATNSAGFQPQRSVPLSKSSSSSSSSSSSRPETLSMPSITLGTMKMGRRTCTETVRSMLSLGFRSVDTAPTYNNEDKVGEALNNSSSSRGSGSRSGSGNVFVIAKVPKRATDAEQVREEFEKTRTALNRGSVDLLLLHWPSDVMAGKTLPEVWKCMEELVRERKCRALGVCNFTAGALLELLRCCTIPPVVNQVERHPLLPQLGLLEVCSRHGVIVQAHTPLGGAKGKSSVLGHSVVERVAKETGLTPAQVVLRWNLQQGVPVVLGCLGDEHTAEATTNATTTITTTTTTTSRTAFLAPSHMRALDAIGKDAKATKRFVAPPFMYGSKAAYSWGDRMPR